MSPGPGPRRGGPVGHRTGVAGILAAALLLGAPPLAAAGQTVERVVNPYGIGAATIIYPDETGLSATDVADLLQWQAHGVEVQRRADGQIRVRIRGGHTSLVGMGEGSGIAPPNPLLIVDGYKVPNDSFSWRLLSLGPSEVERVVVLRDLASAAIYGLRASRGVILVYTRRR